MEYRWSAIVVCMSCGDEGTAVCLGYVLVGAGGLSPVPGSLDDANSFCASLT
jgi:hypothetical protein